MESNTTAALALCAVLIPLAMGQWIGLALCLSGLILMGGFLSTNLYPAVGHLVWTISNNFVLSAVPLFIFMGAILMRAGLSERLYKGISPWVSKLPGGLLHANIAACSIFAAVSGSSVATAATVGKIALPELKRRRYDDKMILGSLAGAGTLGLLIPPSIPMIIYASVVGESVGRLFAGGMIIGLLIAFIFMVYVAIRCFLNPKLAPKEPSVRWKEKLKLTLGLIPTAILIVLVLGGIYSGIVTPTESAAVGAAGAMIIAAFTHTLSIEGIIASLKDAVEVTCMVLLIMIGATILQFILANMGLLREVASVITSFGGDKLTILVIVTLLYLVLGCFLDGVSMMLLTLPVTYPIMMGVGFDPVWFGVVLIIYIELSLITPPVGLNLFVLKGMTTHTMADISIGVLPYALLLLLGVVLAYLFPDLILWLPRVMYG